MISDSEEFAFASGVFGRGRLLGVDFEGDLMGIDGVGHGLEGLLHFPAPSSSSDVHVIIVIADQL